MIICGSIIGNSQVTRCISAMHFITFLNDGSSFRWQSLEVLQECNYPLSATLWLDFVLIFRLRPVYTENSPIFL